MFKNYYTTQMSADVKQLQTRFTKMRSDIGKRAKIMSVVMTAAILTTTLFATVVMAAVDGSDIHNGLITVNGEQQTIDIKRIENSRYLNTDSYFVPLRKTFELLGCKINYNVKKSNEHNH